MYLEGQLPLGPDSPNLGGQPTPGGNSALDGRPVIAPTPSFEQGGPLIGYEGDPSASERGGANTFFVLDGSYGFGPPPAPVVNGPSFDTGGLNLGSGGLLANLLARINAGIRGGGDGGLAADGALGASLAAGPGGGIDSGVNGSIGARIGLGPFGGGGGYGAGGNYGGDAGGGDVVISPSLATANEVVQAPYTEPKNPGYKIQGGYDACGAYGADGSLVSLRNRTMRTGLGGICKSGEQAPTPDTIPSSGFPWGLIAVLGVIVYLGDN